jgi:prepilin-type N-terminal cleavage/methylation domain-containing protein
MKKPLNSRNGFTLIEILIVVVLGSAIVLVVSNLSGNITLLNGLVGQELQSKSDVSQTLQIVTEEIQSAADSGNGSYPIASASTSSFTFYDDINHNGTIEQVNYFVTSSTLYKGVIEPTGTPATYPTSTETITSIIGSVTIPTSTPLFQYFDATYTGTQAPMAEPVVVSNIRLVLMSFEVVTSQPGESATTPQQFSTLVDIRNLRSN